MPAGDLPDGVGQQEEGAALRKRCDPVADFGDISEGSVRLLMRTGARSASLHGVAGQHGGGLAHGLRTFLRAAGEDNPGLFLAFGVLIF